eukprot:symbB.v1.2.039636.t1/scaffold6698.1/size16104/3
MGTYIRIQGVKYYRELWVRADRINGAISKEAAEQLWRLASDGGITTVKRRTLSYIAEQKKFTVSAKSFWEQRLAELSPVESAAENSASETTTDDEEMEPATIHPSNPYIQIQGKKYYRELWVRADKIDGAISKEAAQQLWRLASDGSGITEVKKRTLRYIAEQKKEKFTVSAKSFWEQRLAELSPVESAAENSASETTTDDEEIEPPTIRRANPYIQIQGIRYHRELWERAVHTADAVNHGAISKPDAEELWRLASDGGMTEKKKMTLSYIAEKLSLTDAAKSVFRQRMAERTPDEPEDNNEEANEEGGAAEPEEANGEEEDQGGVEAPAFFMELQATDEDRQIWERAVHIARVVNHGAISQPDAENLWRLASDGSGMTEVKKSTLRYIAEKLPLTDLAARFFQQRLAQFEDEPSREPLQKRQKTCHTVQTPAGSEPERPRETEAQMAEAGAEPSTPTPARGKYTTISGVYYDRQIWDAAVHVAGEADGGEISLLEADKLWGLALQHGRRMTVVKKRTLKYILDTLPLSTEAAQFFRQRLAEGPKDSQLPDLEANEEPEGEPSREELPERQETFLRETEEQGAHGAPVSDSEFVSPMGEAMPSVPSAPEASMEADAPTPTREARAEPAEPTAPTPTPSRYITINGVLYDRQIWCAAVRAADPASGSEIFLPEAQSLWGLALHGGANMDVVKKRTLRYVAQRMPLNPDALQYLNERLSELPPDLELSDEDPKRGCGSRAIALVVSSGIVFSTIKQLSNIASAVKMVMEHADRWQFNMSG